MSNNRRVKLDGRKQFPKMAQKIDSLNVTNSSEFKIDALLEAVEKGRDSRTTCLKRITVCTIYTLVQLLFATYEI